MTEIATESDLFKLFFEKPLKHGYIKRGDGFIYYEALRQVLDAKSFGEDGQSALPMGDDKRFYLVADRWSVAVVRQCDLRATARALNNGKGDLFVGYLGVNETV